MQVLNNPLFTPPANATKMKAYIQASSVSGDKLVVGVDLMQIERSSTPHPYVPYGHMGLEVQGKNLIDEARFINGFIDPGYSSFRVADDSVGYFVPVKKNTVYTVSCDYANRLRIGLTNNDSLVDGMVFDSIPVATIYAPTFPTTINTGEFSHLFVQLIGANQGLKPTKPQLELGSTATEYEPYYHTTTPIPLPAKGFAAKIGDYTDRLEVDSAGGCVWENEVDGDVFDGSSDESITRKNPYRFDIGLSRQAVKVGFLDTPTMICNRWIPTSRGAIDQSPHVGASLDDTGNYMRIGVGDQTNSGGTIIDSVSDLRT